ncbi:MAG: MgtC/SapB family protein [Candidatus Paceibacterota bacterium]|jgi:putative Mg2+ transporter-C (MgtC) family protein
MQLFILQNSDIFLSLVIAMLLGLVIGTERLFARKSANMRTFALVSMGSALFVIISKMMTDQLAPGVSDPLRIASQIVVGIGFLGAGLIIFEKGKITGLTTATGLWVVAGIGMACGFGLYNLAVIATVLTLFIFIILWFVEEQLKKISDLSEDEGKDNHD